MVQGAEPRGSSGADEPMTNCKHFLDSCEGVVSALKERKKSIDAAIKRTENQAKWIKERLLYAHDKYCDMTGEESVAGSDIVLSSKKHGGKRTLETDTDLIPHEYKKYTITKTPRKLYRCTVTRY